jgi:adenylosuccinate synthase
MKVDVLLGLQWGDEGKGKIVDKVATKYDIVARFQGGPNAGHTIELDNFKHVLHTIPSGIFNKTIINIIGNGVIIDPVILRNEINSLKKLGVDLSETLLISKRAHLILPSHIILDKASEEAKGNDKIGSTLKGIGPTYMDKTGRNGLRMGDINSPQFLDMYRKLVNKHKQLLSLYNYKYDISEYESEWFDSIEFLKSYKLIDSEIYINNSLNNHKNILAEGAQGTLLDIDFGTYPFVTSSNTLSSGACTGLGIAPGKIGKVIGIFKAYCTRVGSGYFPTELSDQTGELLRNYGNEYGSTTGRARRCGWLDLTALKYSIMLNGVTELIMTKIDVLNSFEKIYVSTDYTINNEKISFFPYEMNSNVKPVYKEFEGWNSSLDSIQDFDKLPVNLLKYIKFIEEEINIPITILSVGPKREQIIFVEK